MRKHNGQAPDLSYPPILQSFEFGTTKIQLLVPDSHVVLQAFMGDSKREQKGLPYWSQVWPSALALCQFLSAHSELLTGKNVLEIAAGLGLPSLYAAHFASTVTCTDYDPESVAWAMASANKNQLSNINFSVVDWNELPLNLSPDTLLISDANYDPSGFAALHRLIQACVDQGCKVVLSTPQRLSAKAFIEILMPMVRQTAVLEITHAGQLVPISVFVIAKTRD